MHYYQDNLVVIDTLFLVAQTFFCSHLSINVWIDAVDIFCASPTVVENISDGRDSSTQTCESGRPAA
jgi:hypothetical protein